MFRTPTSRGQRAEGRGRKSEEGFTLAAVLVILTLIAVIVAYTVPEQWSMVMKREREKQTIFLMKQYARAIKAWSMKNGGMPTSLDQIVQAKSPRVIRGTGKWPCPLTGKEDDWILVPFGAIQNPPQGGQQLQSAGSKLNKQASPRDYVGPFVGVRPAAEGPSFIALNGAADYGEWVYTVLDLELEISMKNAADSAQ